MFERVVGPFNGYFIASYACPVGELGDQYLGYAKVCRRRPSSYLDAAPVANLCAEGAVLSPIEALDRAEARARLVVANAQGGQCSRVSEFGLLVRSI
jgi:hypothetical protein